MACCPLVAFRGRFAMTVKFYEDIKAAGVRSYPNEACGVVVKVGKKSVFVQCDNAAGDPTQNFLIHHEDYAKASERGEVIAIWHTHPEHPAQPSEADQAGCNASEIPWFIVALYKRENGFEFSDLIEVKPNGEETPYEGRPYVFGTFDCYTLCRDFYRREFGVELGEYPRVYNFWNQGLDFFTKGFPEQGFVELVDQKPQHGDLMIMQVNSRLRIANHIAIYIEGGYILHHCQGRLSRKDVFGGMWADSTVHHIRHKTKC